MANGFLNGAVLGAIVAVAGAGAISVLTGPVGRGEATPEAVAVEVPAGSGFNGARDDRAAELPSDQPGTQPAPLPTVTAPDKDDLAAIRGADVEPGQQPRAEAGQAGLVAPRSSGETPGMAGAEDSTVARVDTTRVAAPNAPETEPSISTEPAQPQPPASEENAGVLTGPQAAGTPSEPDEPVPEAAADTMQEPVQGTESQAQNPLETAREEVVIKITPEAAGVEEEVVVSTPAATAPTVEQPSGEGAKNSDPERNASADTLPAEAPLDPGAEVKPEVVSGAGIGTPATAMPKAAAGVQTGRLPSVGRAVDESRPTAEETPEPVVDAAALPPVKRYAEPFQGDENKPKMAIVLIDEGQGPVGVEALSTFPYPLSFAVDTSRPDAEAAMAKYRAAGFEVLAMVRLPEGATPVDVEQALPVMMAKVPEAVGVMEAPGDGIQFDRKVSDQVAQILGANGYGLLLYSKGLNTAQKLAAKNGVPSATIFRDFDAQGQNTSAIRRFLNHGALKAESEEGVVMVGRLKPDTVTALLLWGLEDRANQVALAPVTELMKPNP